MATKILHVLSQRPSRTGSGITLDALVRYSHQAGYEQQVVIGIPADQPTPEVGGIQGNKIRPVTFGRHPGSADLEFLIPGMSDVMPYPSTVWSTMTSEQLDAYRQVWQHHLMQVVEHFQPDLIHSHHAWLVGAMLKDVAPQVPIITHCHGTALRQMELCPDLANEARTGCRRNDCFLVLHQDHADRYTRELDLLPSQVRVIGAGYRDDLFYTVDRHSEDAGKPQSSPSCQMLYAGKFSRAKGLPWLLDAMDRIHARWPACCLKVAGGGAGPESETLLNRMQQMPQVEVVGMLNQSELAEVMRQSDVFVLPSLYEGLPLVLVEAIACGCRAVSTGLPGVLDSLALPLGSALQLVPMPRLSGIDEPHPDAEAGFVDDLVVALQRAAELGPLPEALRQPVTHFTWRAIAGHIHDIWEKLLSQRPVG